VRAQHAFLSTTLCVAVIAAISCQGPTGPNGPSQSPESLTHIDIDGPSSVTPDSTIQYRAIAHVADGSSRDVTAQARWVSSDSAVLSLTPAGIATAHAIGESQITTQYLNLRAGFGVLVLSSGTYRVAGVVRESGLPVAGATVEVVESPGTTTVTDALGAYRFYGVVGDIHVRVTKDGYKPVSSTVTVGENETLDFALEPLSPLADVSGLYTLTLTADSCGVAPEAERTRTYDAQVTQDGPQLKVVLSGARFRTQGDRGNGFTGRIAPDGITFNLTGWNEFVYDDIYFSVVEVLAENPPRLLTVSGTMSATRSASGISGFLNGNISAVRALGQYSDFTWWSCSSRKHQFVLVRQ
jgi:hypothetical protein